ncbi:MAG: glycosyltransferase, partial [Ignavibacteria bacterium]
IAQSSQEMHDYAVQLLKDDSLRIRMAQNGRSLIEQYFSWDAIFTQLDAILLDVLHKSKAES